MRYKEYNVNKVLEQSISLFWQNGFNGCSINEIVEKTGVNRFSLYQEFGNKEGILYKSLLLYRKRYCNDKLALLESKGDLKWVLKSFYLSFLQESEPVLGCYFIHIGTELADSDFKIKTSVDEYLKEIHILLVKLLCNNDYEKDDAEFRARHLLGLYCTAMSFCLIHSKAQRESYISNGINLIVTTYAKITK